MSVLGDSVINDSSIIVELDQELMYACEPLLAQMPFPPYDLSILDLLMSGKVVFLVEKDTAQFLLDVQDCMEVKFLQPDDWDSTDIQYPLYMNCPGANGYYQLIYRRNHFDSCP